MDQARAQKQFQVRISTKIVITVMGKRYVITVMERALLVVALLAKVVRRAVLFLEAAKTVMARATVVSVTVRA